MRNRGINAALASALLLVCACEEEPKPAPEQRAQGESEATEPGLKVDRGIDLDSKTIRIGALNDESGPAATIGKPYAIAKRILAEQVNAGGSGFLPEGWKVELVEKDHGYNSQRSRQAYKQIKDDVLFIATSFGTPNTLPLLPMLERDQMIALPASLSSEMAKNRHTIPPAASYELEARRAIDWVVAEAEKTDKGKEGLKLGIVYQQDDYGEDGLRGWKKGAEAHGLSLATTLTVALGQRDFAAVVSSLKEAGATHVLLTILPSAAGPLLGTAAQLQYKPTWIGQSPSWIDGFFKPEVIPPKVFDTYHWAASATYWNEDVPGMKDFLQAYEKFGKNKHPPDFYLILSYSQGRYGLEVVKRAIEAGDATRAGLMAAVKTIDSFTAGGLIQPIDTSVFPYNGGDKARIMKPDFENKSWTEIAPWAEPGASTASAEPPAPAPAADDETAQAQEAPGTGVATAP